jgi:hypothetical protein
MMIDDRVHAEALAKAEKLRVETEFNVLSKKYENVLANLKLQESKTASMNKEMAVLQEKFRLAEVLKIYLPYLCIRDSPPPPPPPPPPSSSSSSSSSSYSSFFC